MMSARSRSVAQMLAVFAFHNLEETVHFEADRRALPGWLRDAGPWSDSSSFAVATIVLTALAGTCGAAGARLGTGAVAEVCARVPAGALLGNAASHMARAVVWRRYNGGLATAPVLAWAAAKVWSVSGEVLSQRQRLAVLAVANAAAVPLILVALRAGQVATQAVRCCPAHRQATVCGQGHRAAA